MLMVVCHAVADFSVVVAPRKAVVHAELMCWCRPFGEAVVSFLFLWHFKKQIALVQCWAFVARLMSITPAARALLWSGLPFLGWGLPRASLFFGSGLQRNSWRAIGSFLVPSPRSFDYWAHHGLLLVHRLFLRDVTSCVGARFICDPTWRPHVHVHNLVPRLPPPTGNECTKSGREPGIWNHVILLNVGALNHKSGINSVLPTQYTVRCVRE